MFLKILHETTLQNLLNYPDLIEVHEYSLQFLLAFAEHFPLSLFRFSLSFDKGNTELLLL